VGEPVIAMTFRTDSPAAVAKLRQKAPVAQVRALNRAIASANVAMVRVIAGDLGVKQGPVRDRLRIELATPARFRARIYANAKRIPLIDLGAKGPEPSRGRGRGVTFKGASGRSTIPNAFIATMKSGHRGVFERAPGRGRRGAPPMRSQLPIRELFGPSIWKVFTKYEAIGLARGREQLIKNLQSEFRFVLAARDAAA
jgi:hypothetical protein